MTNRVVPAARSETRSLTPTKGGRKKKPKKKQLGNVDGITEEAKKVLDAGPGINFGGLRFAKGDVVTCNLRRALHSEDNFPDPLTFRPERFATPGEVPKFAFVPFGFAGGRFCPGKNYVRYITNYVMAEVLLKYELQLCDEGKGVEIAFGRLTSFPTTPITCVATPV